MPLLKIPECEVKMRAHLIAFMLVIGVLFGYGITGAENNKWNESRQFEQSLEKAAPDAMRFIWATHILEQGLEVQLAPSIFHRTYLDEQAFYKKVSEHWKSSEFVRAKRYPGKVQFMRLDMPVKTVD